MPAVAVVALDHARSPAAFARFGGPMSSIATSRLKADEEAGLLAAIIRSSEDAIISKSLDGCITSWNSAAERLFGYSAAEAVGQPISMLFSHGGMPEERRLVAQIERGIAVEHFETVRRTKDGRMIEVSMTLSQIVNAAGDVDCLRYAARDGGIRNLISNGVKYNRSPHKLIEIGCLPPRYADSGGSEPQQVFYVRDNGIGIAPEFQEEIFRIFKRLNLEDETVKGTGVGLTFVKKIVERHHGCIWVESNLGKG